MAWMMTHLFLRECEMGALLPKLESLLVGARGSGRHELLGQPPPIQLSEPQHGWQVLMGLRPWVHDLRPAAEILSASARTTICCELVGNCLLLRISQFGQDGAAATLQSPAELPFDDVDEFSGAMPLYDDVEGRAYGTLRSLGIPAALVCCGASSLETPQQEIAGSSVSLDEKGDLREQPASLKTAGEPADEAPLVFRQHSRTFGLTVDDERYLQGKPTSKTVERVLELQRATEQRLKQRLPDTPINLNLTYYCGRHQQALDALLMEQGHAVPPTASRPHLPWWAFWHYFGTGWRKKD